MASQSETGHNKNVANFKTLNNYLASLGSKYNPTRETIKLANLTMRQKDSETALNTLQNAMPAYTAAIDKQEAAFKPLDKLVTRVVRAYKACVDNPAEAETAISLQKKKINGKTAKTSSSKKKPANDKETQPDDKGTRPDDNETPAAEKDTISTSQLSYDYRLANFEQLIKLVAANPNYQPNEPDLQAASLQNYAAELRQKTEAVDLVAAPIINARIARNAILYHPQTGLFPVTINHIKDYVSSVFGPRSEEAIYINSLKFRGK